jgi:hypothetical protein
MYTEQLTQRLAIANAILPQTVNNATLTTGAVDLQQSKRAIFLLTIGTVAAGGSVSAKLQESTDNSTFTDLAGTNLALTGLTTASKISTLEVNYSQITKRYVRLSITETGSQNVLVCASALGDEGQHKPNNVNNGSQVATQNVVA